MCVFCHADSITVRLYVPVKKIDCNLLSTAPLQGYSSLQQRDNANNSEEQTTPHHNFDFDSLRFFFPMQVKLDLGDALHQDSEGQCLSAVVTILSHYRILPIILFIASYVVDLTTDALAGGSVRRAQCSVTVKEFSSGSDRRVLAQLKREWQTVLTFKETTNMTPPPLTNHVTPRALRRSRLASLITLHLSVTERQGHAPPRYKD